MAVRFYNTIIADIAKRAGMTSWRGTAVVLGMDGATR
jgi:hypothetical protein